MFETTVAYMKFKFRAVVQLARVQEPSEIEARIEDRPIGLIGRPFAKSPALLNDSTLTGKRRSIDQPMFRTKVKQMEKQFADRLRATFENAQEAG